MSTGIGPVSVLALSDHSTDAVCEPLSHFWDFTLDIPIIVPPEKKAKFSFHFHSHHNSGRQSIGENKSLKRAMILQQLVGTFDKRERFRETQAKISCHFVSASAFCVFKAFQQRQACDPSRFPLFSTGSSLVQWEHGVCLDST